MPLEPVGTSSTVARAMSPLRSDVVVGKAARPKALTNRAALAAVSTAIRVVVQLAIGLGVTPIVALGLGREMYGAWAMIQQVIGYVALADLRVTGTIKFTLAVREHEDDWSYKRQQIGAALLILTKMAVVICAAGAVAIWLAPTLIHVDPQSVPSIRLALAICLVGLIATEFASIPGNVLRGQNLEYKAMGLSALAAVLTAALTVGAVLRGGGLPRLALAGICGDVLVGFILVAIIRRNVPWFGVEYPTKDVLKAFWLNTVWLSLASLGFVLQNASDVLLVGYLRGPRVAAVYGSTGAMLRLATSSMYSLTGAANPGIASLCGQRAWARVQQARHELHLAALVLVAALATPLLLFNGSFVSLWLRPEFYAGDHVNIALVLLAIAGIPVRVDTMLIDAMLMFRARAVTMIVTSIVGMILGAALAPALGVAGLVYGLALGTAVCGVTYSTIIAKRSSVSAAGYLKWMARPCTAAAVLLCTAAGAPAVHVAGFATVMALLAATGTFALAFMWYVGLDTSHRAALIRRLWASVPTPAHTIAEPQA